MNAGIGDKLMGYPLAEFAGEAASKADLFLVASVLFRLCTVQNKALRSIKDGLATDFEEGLDEADAVLNELYGLLQIDEPADERR